MNINDGTIIAGNGPEFAELLSNDHVRVTESEMTPKQRKERRVSLNDRRSQLGKRLTHERKKRKLGRNESCPCGSGRKYKHCCLNK